jgi:anthranilate/para-aminobenzoate synthase component I
VIALSVAPLDPAEASRRLAGQPGAFWLSGPAPDGVGIARDFVGANPARVVQAAGADDVEVIDRIAAAWKDARLAWATETAGIPVAVGWLSYDLGRHLVGLRTHPGPRDGWPAAEMHFHDAVWIRELGGEARIFARDGEAAARLAAALERPARTRPPHLGPLRPEHADPIYLDGVRRILDYLVAGDSYQVNLARRMSAACHGGDPVELAVALRRRAPAPHASFIAAADGAGFVVGNSPERFLAVDANGAIETRPIKGTRPREGAEGVGGAGGAAALAASAKDRAEHVMIVDLERNDLGRVCRTGSVQVASLARVVTLPTVHHLVSTVRGVLRPDAGLRDILAATFPGGSITGAPKRRAMQIIDELEPVPRGLYTGATGWLGAAGDLDLAIAIRTALVRDGRVVVSVGGGIVAESTPEGELAETEVKARAFAQLEVQDL